MKTPKLTGSNTAISAVAAAIVTTVLVSSLVESFHPAQLLQFNKDASGDQTVALERRKEAGADWT